MTLLSKVGSKKIYLVTGFDNKVEVELVTDLEDGSVIALDSSNVVTAFLVTRDVDRKLAGPFPLTQTADPFFWELVIPQVELDSGVLVNPEAPDTLFVQEITRERSLCYMQIIVQGPDTVEPYLLDTHLQRGFS